MTHPGRRRPPQAHIAPIPAGIAVRIAILSLILGVLGSFTWVAQ